MRCAVLLLLAAGAGLAQSPFGVDERRVVSPDGQIVFRLAVAPQEGYALSRLAYQVDYRGKRLIDTSYLGIDLWDQEPILGENVGLISFAPGAGQLYNSAVAGYMQNGSLGRRIDIEMRAYNEGVAFRYTVHRSAGVLELLIADETTEVALASKRDVSSATPFVAEQPGVGWLGVSDVPKVGFPGMHLARTEPGKFLTRLARADLASKVAYSGTTPFVLPWRVLAIGPDEKCVRESKFLQLLLQ